MFIFYCLQRHGFFFGSKAAAAWKQCVLFGPGGCSPTSASPTVAAVRRAQAPSAR
jgi:hypothetical protein